MLVNRNSQRLIDVVNVADNSVSVCFTKLAIDFVQPASFEEPIKNVGRLLLGFDMVDLGEEDLVDRLQSSFLSNAYVVSSDS